jgi:hypothetical protein
MLARFEPGWLLLLWCGLAASLVALPIARAPAHEVRMRGPAGRRVAGLLAELLALPILYAIALEMLGQSGVLAGAALGALHGGVAVLAATLRPAAGGGIPATRARAFLARTVYGAVFAFLHLVPAP